MSHLYLLFGVGPEFSDLSASYKIAHYLASSTIRVMVSALAKKNWLNPGGI